jgi:hypothetical protein
MCWNQANCELKKKNSLSSTLVRSHNLVVFIYRKVVSWGVRVPQGVSRFVNGEPHMHCPKYHTRHRRPA